MNKPVTKPFSVRFSEATSRVIEALSQKSGDTPSGYIRSVIERDVKRDFKFQRDVDALLLRKDAFIARLYESHFIEGAYTPMQPHEIAAVMMMFHDAYRVQGNANQKYVYPLLDIIGKLVGIARSNQIHLDLEFIRDRMGMHQFIDFDAGIEVVKQDFKKYYATSHVETICRAFDIIENSLNEFPVEPLQKVFGKDVMVSVFPVLSSLVRSEFSVGYGFGGDMLVIKFGAGNLDFDFSNSFHRIFLHVVGGAHEYVFGTRFVLGFASLLSSGAMFDAGYENSDFKKGDVNIRVLKRDASGNKYIINNDDGVYRLNFNEDEFRDFCVGFELMMGDPAWKKMIQSMTNFRGDV